jgi:arylsulfatase A-like enzyme
VLSDDDVQAMTARYDEELVALDGQLGGFFQRLRELDLWEETLIVVTSDHGEEFYERGGVGHLSGLHDELIRVPLVAKAPASWSAPAGLSVQALVELRDLTPTFLHAAGVQVSEDSYSLVPWIVGRPDRARSRQFIVSESSRELAVRTESLKLIAPREGGAPQLYDLAADPGETTNVASARRPDLSRLRAYLGNWLEGLQPVTPERRELSEDTVEGLRALGYLD